MKLYPTRYRARKENPGAVIVRVDGGFVALAPSDYRQWRQQK